MAFLVVNGWFVPMKTFFFGGHCWRNDTVMHFKLKNNTCSRAQLFLHNTLWMYSTDYLSYQPFLINYFSQRCGQIKYNYLIKLSTVFLNRTELERHTSKLNSTEREERRRRRRSQFQLVSHHFNKVQLFCVFRQHRNISKETSWCSKNGTYPTYEFHEIRSTIVYFFMQQQQSLLFNWAVLGSLFLLRLKVPTSWYVRSIFLR